MIPKSAVKQVGEFTWEIGPDFDKAMRVPARFFCADDQLEDIVSGRSVNQLINVASLPGIKSYALAMPDMHEGYGFPIGAVAAIDMAEGVVSPGGIGYDINCGVRLLIVNLSSDDISAKLEKLANVLKSKIPVGLKEKSRFKINRTDLDEIIENGLCSSLIRTLLGNVDSIHCESGGKLDNADPNKISGVAKQRAIDQLGTVGAGNHFVEIGYVEEVYDEKKAAVFNVTKNKVSILIHCGSRGLGHQCATDYIEKMLEKQTEFGLSLKDPELASAPLSSKQAKDYLQAMEGCANFAWANRAVLSHLATKAFESVFKVSEQDVSLIYDICHNIAKQEEISLDGKSLKALVHRKGATRAFGPKLFEKVSAEFKGVGQPVIIPGSMGTGSYLLASEDKSREISFSSSCHGAGRVLSRHKARKHQSGEALRKELAGKNIIIKCSSLKYLSEEAPYAYKDVDRVVDVIHDLGIATKVARFKPLIVLKG